jgi:hypothetical protein
MVHTKIVKISDDVTKPAGGERGLEEKSGKEGAVWVVGFEWTWHGPLASLARIFSGAPLQPGHSPSE